MKMSVNSQYMVKNLPKILLANKFYYPRGGDCIYTVNLEELLKQYGHEVAVFSMQHPQNLPSAYSKYFADEIEFPLENKKRLLEAVVRPIGFSKDVRTNFTALLNDFRPDVVHLNNIHTQLSPILAQIAHGKGVKVVWTLHDYKLLCPRYDCRRDNKACELCFSDKKSVLKYSCLKGSKAASMLAYLEAIKWNRIRLEKYTDTFICPSSFMKTKMIKGGFDEIKLQTLLHFINNKKITGKIAESKDNYYCYIGRISSEKGIETLIQAAIDLPYKLKIIGSGPLEDKITSSLSENIEFLGHKSWEEIKSILGNARFLVTPSECYEVLGLSGLEALCLGVPILGANIGGIPELIKNRENGILFESGNVEDLKTKIQEMFTLEFDYKTIAENAQNSYNQENYYQQLMKIYK